MDNLRNCIHERGGPIYAMVLGYGSSTTWPSHATCWGFAASYYSVEFKNGKNGMIGVIWWTRKIVE